MKERYLLAVWALTSVDLNTSENLITGANSAVEHFRMLVTGVMGRLIFLYVKSKIKINGK